MSDKIGMNHTHIDFHKGTHGYPIKNADDMMKPCPLMPDGAWDLFTIEFLGDGITSVDDLAYNVYLNGELKVSGIGSESQSVYATNSRLMIQPLYGNVMVMSRNPNSQLLECRVGYYGRGTLVDGITLQGTYAWQIESNLTQRYYVLSSTTFYNRLLGANSVFNVYVYSARYTHEFPTTNSNENG